MFKKIAGAAVIGALFSAAAHAAPVNCDDDPMTSGRFVTVDPAKVGGLCAFQDGNLKQVEEGPSSNQPKNNGDAINTALIAAMAVLLDKDVVSGTAGDLSEGLLRFTGSGNSGSGTWQVLDAAWAANSRLFLGFHFGGGSGSPDSFLVELQYRNLAGTFELNPAEDSNGLSNIYLFGKACTPADECDRRPPNEVPAPGALALLGLGLGGLALRRSLRKQA